MNTKRLKLRPIKQEDVERIVELWTDPRVTEHLGGPKDADLVRGYSVALAIDPEAVFEEDGDRWWSVCLRDSEEWIGKCGLLAKEVENEDEIELSYFFLPSAWGNGYATEAARRIAEYAFEELLLSALIALINPGNVPSAKVAARLGMSKEKTIIRSEDTVRDVYRLKAGDL